MRQEPEFRYDPNLRPSYWQLSDLRKCQSAKHVGVLRFDRFGVEPFSDIKEEQHRIEKEYKEHQSRVILFATSLENKKEIT